MSIFEKIQRNIDKTWKALRKQVMELPFPPPSWLCDPLQITNILCTQHGTQLKGMIDTFRVGKEEVGTFLCTDREGRGTLSLGAECRGEPGWVIVKDCAPSGYPVGAFHVHPSEQPTLSYDDLKGAISNVWVLALGWRDENGYWLKVVTLGTYHGLPYDLQKGIDNDLYNASILDGKLGHMHAREKGTPKYQQTLMGLMDILGDIEQRLGMHVTQL